MHSFVLRTRSSTTLSRVGQCSIGREAEIKEPGGSSLPPLIALAVATFHAPRGPSFRWIWVSSCRDGVEARRRAGAVVRGWDSMGKVGLGITYKLPLET